MKPNGSMTLSFASVYVDYFAGKAGDSKNLMKVNEFMNRNFIDIAVSDRYPNAYMINLKVDV